MLQPRHQISHCNAVKILVYHSVKLVPHWKCSAVRCLLAGLGTTFQAGNRCERALIFMLRPSVLFAAVTITMTICKFLLIIQYSIPVIIILHCRFNCFLRKHGTVNLVSRKTVKSLSNRLVCKL